MSTPVISRALKPQDIPLLRQLCCDVANRGKPVESIFPDRVLVADLLTNYYTRYEPSATFVAEAEGQVVGYINGCLDNRRYGLAMFWIIVPGVLLKAFKRGTFFNPIFWQHIAAMLRNWRRLFSWRRTSFNSHQGHMHIGIAETHRHQHIGERLVNALCDYARTKGAHEISASVHDANTAACRFFEKLGFTVRERHDMVVSHGHKIEQYQGLLYVKDLV